MLTAAALIVAAAGPLGALEAKLADPAWDGVKVPEGQQCQKFGGQGKSPALAVSGIPSGVSHLAGAYLPPCSGGRGNSYYVTVKAVHKQGDETHELGSAVVEMGKY